ncbi:MAG TPA: ATP-binding protein [Mycobacterium sp.]|nr:ATP-binding protein [Mycobacterium sp.]
MDRADDLAAHGKVTAESGKYAPKAAVTKRDGYKRNGYDGIGQLRAVPPNGFDTWGNEPVDEPPPDPEEQQSSAGQERPADPRATWDVVDGGSFIFDQPQGTPAVWGKDTDVLWPEGESLMIAGQQGLGKTTLMGQLVRALLGVCDGEVLGLPVPPIDGRILYLAMDRPRQIARSLARQFRLEDRPLLEERLIFRPGPPPADIAKRPELLLTMARDLDAQVVFVDSVKDAALGLSSDEVGAAYNRARQYVIADGRELCDSHHAVKRGPNGAPVKDINDIYGSAWLTSGCGSVVLLTGEPGDPIVGFRHVKAPVNEVGPWQLLHDSVAGELRVEVEISLVDLVKAKGVDGLTARDAAVALFEANQPSRAQKEKARRKLVKLQADGVLTVVERDGLSAYFLAAQGTQ